MFRCGAVSRLLVRFQETSFIQTSLTSYSSNDESGEGGPISSFLCLNAASSTFATDHKDQDLCVEVVYISNICLPSTSHRCPRFRTSALLLTFTVPIPTAKFLGPDSSNMVTLWGAFKSMSNSTSIGDVRNNQAEGT